MKNTPYKIRNNEIYGDLTAWLTAHAGDNESDLMRLKRNLRLAQRSAGTSLPFRARSPARAEGFTNVCDMGYNKIERIWN